MNVNARDLRTFIARTTLRTVGDTRMEFSLLSCVVVVVVVVVVTDVVGGGVVVDATNSTIQKYSG